MTRNIYLLANPHEINPNSNLAGRPLFVNQDNSTGKVLFTDAGSGEKLWLTTSAKVVEKGYGEGKCLEIQTQNSVYRLIVITQKLYRAMENIMNPPENERTDAPAPVVTSEPAAEGAEKVQMATAYGVCGDGTGEAKEGDMAIPDAPAETAAADEPNAEEPAPAPAAEPAQAPVEEAPKAEPIQVVNKTEEHKPIHYGDGFDKTNFTFNREVSEEEFLAFLKENNYRISPKAEWYNDYTKIEGSGNTWSYIWVRVYTD